VPATVAAIHRIYRDRQKIIARELQFIQANGIEKIVADVPYLAGDIAEAAGIPCIGNRNFTWEWIYQPYLECTAGAEALTEMIRTGYSNMTRFCRLPFHHEEGSRYSSAWMTYRWSYASRKEPAMKCSTPWAFPKPTHGRKFSPGCVAVSRPDRSKPQPRHRPT